MKMSTDVKVKLTQPSWLWSKYIRHNPFLLTNPDEDAAEIRRAIVTAGPIRKNEDFTIEISEDAAEWLLEQVREWVAEDTERDGSMAMALFADHIDDQLDTLA